MAYQFTTQEDDQRQLIVTVDVPEEDVGRHLRETARRLSRDVRIPGFRPGKAPYGVILQRFGESTLRFESLEHMLDDMFEQVMAQLEEPPYLPATVQSMDINPMQVVFAVPLRPEVELGDYRSLRRTFEPVTVSESAVDEALEQVRQQHQVVEAVERPADFDDLVTVGGRGVLLDEAGSEQDVIFDEESVDLLLDNNRIVFGPEFVTQLVGMSAGEEKKFTVELPDAFDDEEDEAAEAEDEEGAAETEDSVAAQAEAAPRRASFDLKILEVKRRELPALDDDLAQSEGEYETLDELREALRGDLRRQADEQARSEQLEAFMADVAADATIAFPPQAVDHELEHMVEEFREQVRGAGLEWEKYLKATGDSEEQLRERMGDAARRRVERGLIMRQFIETERLRVAEDELEERIAARLEGVNPQLHDYLQNYFLQGRGRDSLASDIMMDKVYDRAVAILSGDAPDLAALEAAEAEEEE